MPGVPVVSEEMSGRQAPPKLDGSFILVDPLDGTREFIAGRDEYTVNVAIISGGKPIAGIVSAPKQHKVWRGIVGRGAERLRMLADGADQPQAIRARRWPAQNAVAVVSRSHLDPATEAFVAQARSGRARRKAARRSSSAASPKAPPMSIRASAPRANGTSRQAMPLSPPPAAS